VADLWIAHDAANATAPAGFYARPPQFAATAGAGYGSRVYVYDYFQDRSRNLRHLGAEAPGMGPLDPRVPPGLAWAYALRDYGAPPTLGAWGIEGSFDIDLLGLETRRTGALVRRLRELEGQPAHARLLRLAGVSRVVALHDRGFEDLEAVERWRGLFDRDVRVFRVPDPRPRVSLVEGARVVAEDAVLDALERSDFDPAREVLLEVGATLPARPELEGRILHVEPGPGRLRVTTRASRAGHLVVLEAHDPGWQGRVDGAPTPVLRANGVFMAVPVGSGEHVVELRYWPAAIQTGLASSLAAVVLGLVLCGRAVRKPG
jgi:hypothetical protein